MTDHPITPPPELVKRLRSEAPFGIRGADAGVTRERHLIAAAYRAGADMELEACCEWLSVLCPSYGRELRAARRPKPPSPKEEALQVLESLIESRRIVDPEYQALRHALEQLDD